MKDRIAKLLSVKSIVTLLLTIVVCVLALTNRTDIEQSYSIC